MFIINNFFISLLFLLIFTMIYFLQEKVYAWNRFIKLGFHKESINFMFGIIMGLIITLTEYVVDRTNSNNNITFLIIGVVILIYFKNLQITLFSLIIPFIYQLISYDITNVMYYEISSVFLIILVVELFKKVLKMNYVWIPLISTLFLLAIISIPLTFTIFTTYNKMMSLEQTLFSYLWSIFHFGIFFYIFRFSISSKILFESSNFSFLNYYRSGLVSLSINNFIRKENVTNAVMNIFYIKFNLKDDDGLHRKEVLESVLERISKNNDSNSILFFAPDNRYGIFKKINSLDDNIEQLVTEQFDIIPKYYRTSRGELVVVSIEVGSSIYGLHDSSSDSLIEYSTFALNTKQKNKTVNLFSTKKYRKSIDDQLSLSLLDKSMALDDYVNVFYPLWNIEDEVKPFGIRAKIENISAFSWRETLEERVYYSNWNKTFYRYFANDAVNKIKDIPLLIDYDISILEDGFSTTDFINQLEIKNIKPQNVFLVIKNIGWSKVKNIKKLKSKISELKKENINFVIDNKTSPAIVKSAFKKVEFVMITTDDASKKYKGASYIFSDLNNIKDIEIATKIKAKIVGGSMIKSEIAFKKFDKQSKIYLEELFKQKGNKNV